MPRINEDREPSWPQYTALYDGRYGRRRQEEVMVLEAQLDADWIALYYLVGHGGRMAISEVRVVPTPRNGLEASRVQDAVKSPARVRVAAGDPNPHTGIALVTGDDEPPRLPATTLRNLLSEDALKAARDAIDQLGIEPRSGLDKIALDAGLRRKRRHKDPYECAVVASVYVDVVRAGGKGNRDVAERLGPGYNPPYVRRTIDYARNRLGYLPRTRQGAAASVDVELTPEAKRVLADGPPSGYVGPALEAVSAVQSSDRGLAGRR
jgi:hypothetical protein